MKNSAVFTGGFDLIREIRHGQLRPYGDKCVEPVRVID